MMPCLLEIATPTSFYSFFFWDKLPAYIVWKTWLLSMKHGCVSGLGCGCGCGCGTRQFLKKVGAGVAGLGD